jgi:hypothetical protein
VWFSESSSDAEVTNLEVKDSPLRAVLSTGILPPYKARIVHTYRSVNLRLQHRKHFPYRKLNQISL